MSKLSDDLALLGIPTINPELFLRGAGGLGVLPVGLISSLFGSKDSGKSWLAGAASAERIALGHHVHWCSFETSDGGALAKARLLMLGVPVEDVEAGFHVYDAKLVDPSRIKPGDLVVVDPVDPAIAHLFKPEATATAIGIHSLIEKLRPLLRAGATVILIDHVPRSAGRVPMYPVGNEAKMTSVDLALAVAVRERLTPGGTGRLELVARRVRPGLHTMDATVAEVEVVSEGKEGPVRISLSPPGWKTAEGMAKRVLDKLPADGSELTATQVQTTVKGRNESLQKVLGELVEEGRITKRKQGRTVFYGLPGNHSTAFPSPAGSGSSPASLSPLVTSGFTMVGSGENGRSGAVPLPGAPLGAPGEGATWDGHSGKGFCLTCGAGITAPVGRCVSCQRAGRGRIARTRRAGICLRCGRASGRALLSVTGLEIPVCAACEDWVAGPGEWDYSVEEGRVLLDGTLGAELLLVVARSLAGGAPLPELDGQLRVVTPVEVLASELRRFINLESGPGAGDFTELALRAIDSLTGPTPVGTEDLLDRRVMAGLIVGGDLASRLEITAGKLTGYRPFVLIVS